ncbi:MAG: ETC complex I subunit [Alphaproteobacteria bacterium]|nr:ETC complex I subunit [Alphaproteobacteria bacterium]
MKNVLIYKPSKTAMQSGRAKITPWLLREEPAKGHYVDPLMHWVGTTSEPGDTVLHFESVDAAIAFAVARTWNYRVLTPQKAKPKAKSYASNFLNPGF